MHLVPELNTGLSKGDGTGVELDNGFREGNTLKDDAGVGSAAEGRMVVEKDSSLTGGSKEGRCGEATEANVDES